MPWKQGSTITGAGVLPNSGTDLDFTLSPIRRGLELERDRVTLPFTLQSGTFRKKIREIKGHSFPYLVSHTRTALPMATTKVCRSYK